MFDRRLVQVFVGRNKTLYQLLPRGHQWISPHYSQVSIGHPLEALGVNWVCHGVSYSLGPVDDDGSVAGLPLKW